MFGDSRVTSAEKILYFCGTLFIRQLTLTDIISFRWIERERKK